MALPALVEGQNIVPVTVCFERSWGDFPSDKVSHSFALAGLAAQAVNLLISTSWAAGITGLSHCAQQEESLTDVVCSYKVPQ
jgi:hypothetical protein